MTRDDPETTRRRVLLGIGSAVTVGLAGCGGDDGTATETETPTSTEMMGETTPGDGMGGMTTTGDGMGGMTTTTGDGMGGMTTTTGDGMGGMTTTTGDGMGTANARVAHMSPDAPNVDVYVDGGDPVLSDVAFGAVSDYLDLSAGEHDVEITAAGDASTSVFDDTVTVEADTDYTLVAAGEISDMADQAFEVLVLEDDNSSIGGNMARLRAVHVSPDAPNVDITAGGGSVVLFDDVPYGGSEYTEVEANDYTVEIRGDTDSNDGEVQADFDVSLNGGTVYTAFAAGYLTPDDDPADTAFDLIVAQDSGGGSMN